MTRLALGALWIATSLVASGCFLWHGDTGDTPDAGSPWDTPPELPDGALPPTVDASLPPIDEPDVSPDERPSDDPGASEWMDPPPASGDPCCDVGEVVGLEAPGRIGGFPVVAWDSSAWGVVWSDAPLSEAGSGLVDADDAFVRLDADARPLAAPRPIWGLGWPTALTYASDRYLVATRGDTSMDLGLLDRSGALVGVTRVEEDPYAPHDYTTTGLARFPLAHVWVSASIEPFSHVRLRAFDDALGPVGAPLDIGEITSRSPAGPALVALKSRLVVFRGTREGLAQTTVTGPELTLASEGTVLRTSTAELPGVSVAATAMRDTAVAVGLDGTHLWSVVYDPFLGEVVHGPTQLAPSVTQSGHGVASDQLGGTVGVCNPDLLPTGLNPPYGRLQFALLDPQGAPIGAPISLGGEEIHPGACAVASAGRDQYVVVFWNLFGTGFGADHTIYAARVTVRR